MLDAIGAQRNHVVTPLAVENEGGCVEMTRRTRRVILVLTGVLLTSGLSVASASSAFAGFSFGH